MAIPPKTPAIDALEPPFEPMMMSLASSSDMVLFCVEALVPVLSMIIIKVYNIRY